MAIPILPSKIVICLEITLVGSNRALYNLYHKESLRRGRRINPGNTVIIEITISRGEQMFML
jgi:hypothetical protein